MLLRLAVGHHVEEVDESELRAAQTAVLKNEPLTGRDRELLDACVSSTIRAALVREDRWQKTPI
jgi:hypothetical protein